MINDKTNFWELPTIDHDLRTISKADPPIVRQYTIKTRLSIEEKEFFSIIDNLSIESIINNITFKNPITAKRWRGSILSVGTQENITATVIFESMKNVLKKEINKMIQTQKNKRKKTKFQDIQNKRKGAVLINK